MATGDMISVPPDIEYPTSDGKPMAETEWHRQDLTDLIETLKAWFDRDPPVYASGNMFMYYVPGNKRKHVSPDVFVVRGVSKHKRANYLVWEEGKAPDCVIELTSKSTKKEDIEIKFSLYQDVLKVQEYFLFDPHVEYLRPPLQGYRLVAGKYVRIREVKGRLPSQVVGLHLERQGWQLRLHNPATKQLLATPQEEHEGRLRAEAEVERLRRKLESIKQQSRRKPDA